MIKETPIDRPHERIALLRGAHILAYRVDRSRLLRYMRLTLHFVLRIIPHFLNFIALDRIKYQCRNYR